MRTARANPAADLGETSTTALRLSRACRPSSHAIPLPSATGTQGAEYGNGENGQISSVNAHIRLLGTYVLRRQHVASLVLANRHCDSISSPSACRLAAFLTVRCLTSRSRTDALASRPRRSLTRRSAASLSLVANASCSRASSAALRRASISCSVLASCSAAEGGPSASSLSRGEGRWKTAASSSVAMLPVCTETRSLGTVSDSR